MMGVESQFTETVQLLSDEVMDQKKRHFANFA